jgi:quercetin dioxygenase-like cupin family protein
MNSFFEFHSTAGNTIIIKYPNISCVNGVVLADYKKLPYDELHRSRQELLYEVYKIEEELEERRKENKHLIRAEDLQWTVPRKVISMKLQGRVSYLVHPALGFNTYNLFVFQYELPPHYEEGTYHKHQEAIKYYLSGRAREIIGDKTYDVKTGDTIFIPANEWHGTQNPYDEPCRFLAVIMWDNTHIQKPAPFVVRKDLYAPMSQERTRDREV